MKWCNINRKNIIFIINYYYQKLVKSFGLEAIIESNLKILNYLDVTINISIFDFIDIDPITN